jgi:glycosyltransferase involved in cell wall biosynthesis
MNQKVLRVAIGSVPKDCGTFTFYRTLRRSISDKSTEVFCVSTGSREAALWDDSFSDDGCVLLARRTSSVKRQSKAFVDWAQQAKVNCVIGLNSVAILSALPHLPNSVRIISRCANGFDQGYRIALSGDERLAGIVALTPRLEQDLVSGYGVDPARISLIPNGVEQSRFEQAASKPRGDGPILQLGYLGRLEHRQKGVLFLPRILAELRDRGVHFRLKIAGHGIHREALERQLAELGLTSQVEFLGTLDPTEVPTFLACVDIFLFPSQFEGCPNALLEAMIAGCVPVAWQIDGITDFIVDDGSTGALVTKGDCQQFAARIAEFGANRNLLASVSRLAAQLARQRFSCERFADAYSRIFREVTRAPAACQPLPWTRFQVEPAFGLTWRSRLPVGVKRTVKHFSSLMALRPVEKS